MGAGISQQNMNRIYYRRLKKIQSELLAVGIESKYERFALYRGDATRGFTINYRTLRASNGETAGMLHIHLTHDGVVETYGQHWDSSKGLERIKNLVW